MRKLLILLILTIFISSCQVQESPKSMQLPRPEPGQTNEVVIDNINTRSLDHENTYTITGKNFKKKVPATPLKWDNFENGVSETELANGWTIISVGGASPAKPTYSKEYPRGMGDLAVRQDYLTTTQYLNAFGLTNQDENNYFTSFHLRYSQEAASSNYKRFMMNTNTEDGDLGYNPKFSEEVYNGNQRLFIMRNCYEENFISWQTENTPEDKWIKFDYYGELGDFNVSNANVKQWQNGKLSAEINDALMNLGPCETWYSENTTGKWNNIFINYYRNGFSEDCEAKGCPAQFWVDDVYIDKTQARIEICNVGEWEKRINHGARCEIQIPTEWSNGEITFQANQGNFENGEQVYVYVINSEGQVNKQGRVTYFQTL